MAPEMTLDTNCQKKSGGHKDSGSPKIGGSQKHSGCQPASACQSDQAQNKACTEACDQESGRQNFQQSASHNQNEFHKQAIGKIGKAIFKTRPLEACPALVLNADYRPLSYYPLSLWSWQEAVKSVFLDRVHILQTYEKQVTSPSFSMQLPSVVALKTYVRPARFPAFTRFNLFLRDKFMCQYCGDTTELTFDHVIPRSRGGTTRWDNVVAACAPCNLRKGNKMPHDVGMIPRQKPYRPTVFELHKNGRLFPPNYLHESWLDYLYWDTELEE